MTKTFLIYTGMHQPQGTYEVDTRLVEELLATKQWKRPNESQETNHKKFKAKTEE